MGPREHFGLGRHSKQKEEKPSRIVAESEPVSFWKRGQTCVSDNKNRKTDGCVRDHNESVGEMDRQWDQEGPVGKGSRSQARQFQPSSRICPGRPHGCNVASALFAWLQDRSGFRRTCQIRDVDPFVGAVQGRGNNRGLRRWS